MANARQIVAVHVHLVHVQLYILTYKKLPSDTEKYQWLGRVVRAAYESSQNVLAKSRIRKKMNKEMRKKIIHQGGNT